MDNFDTVALLQRLDRLERQNRLMKLAGLAVVLCVALILFCGAKTSNNKVIEAQEFRVVDGNGKLRAFLDTTGLCLYDENLHPRVSLNMNRFTINDKNIKAVATLGVVEEGNPALYLWGKNEGTVGLSFRNGDPFLTLFDRNGNSLPVR